MASKIRANFTIDRHLLDAFRTYCEQHHYKMSTIVEKLLREELGIEKSSHDHADHRGIM